MASCKVEAEVLNTWLNFMEDTWVLQCSYTEMKEKEVKYVLGLTACDCFLLKLLLALSVNVVL